jgi:hypothetical protein
LKECVERIEKINRSGIEASLNLYYIMRYLNQSQTTTDAYSRGYSDAVADAHYENGHGYDSSCPNGHSEAYCQNYQSGYTTGWRSVTNHIP